jgi:PPM family protein phosphatase
VIHAGGVHDASFWQARYDDINCWCDMGDEDADDRRRAALSPLLASEHFNPLSASVRVEFGARSRPGNQRANEDHYLIFRVGRSQKMLASSLREADLPGHFEEYGYVMLVADGVGPLGSGAVASRLAISTLAHLLLYFGNWNLRIDERTAADVTHRAEWFYHRTADALSAKSHLEPLLAGMGTTLTAVFSAGDDLFYAHVGHSRAYLFRDGQLILLTRDHTLAQRLVERHGPVPVEPVAQDLKHILTDALGGAGRTPEVDIERLKLWDNDCILLCTDGLTDVVDDEAIADALALPRQLDEQCQALTDLAVARRGNDDVTVLLANYRIPA